MNGREREIVRTVSWAQAEYDRRRAGRPLTTMEELALIYEIGGDIVRLPRPSRWQRLLWGLGL